jgi:Rad3-related DNA helicase
VIRGKKIFTQGISGGKAKILSLFRRADEEKVLIGIIDNWIDESYLWKEADSLIIAKIPFEPPTDPYFLARTVGMRNNFEEYSCPMMIIYLNTLIQRAKSINPALRIYCLDDRLEKSIW